VRVAQPFLWDIHAYIHYTNKNSLEQPHYLTAIREVEIIQTKLSWTR
jgi:hypothetical protein